jgi:hypothetical protein
MCKICDEYWKNVRKANDNMKVFSVTKAIRLARNKKFKKSLKSGKKRIVYE